MTLSQRPCERGLSVTELLVVTAVLSVLGGIVYSTFRTQTLTYSANTTQTLTQSTLRIWLSRMVKDIRRAGFDPTGSGQFTISTFTCTQFTFTLDPNNTGTYSATDPAQNIGYKLENGTLYQWLGGSNWRAVLNGVGSLTFVYRDAQGNTLRDSQGNSLYANNGCASPSQNASVGRSIGEVEIAISAQPTTYGGTVASSAPTPALTTNASGAKTILTTASSPDTASVLTQVTTATLRN